MNGENAYQANAALYHQSGVDDPLALSAFTQQLGPDMGFNNWVEIDRQLQTMTHLAAGRSMNRIEASHLAIATKHGNPCGAAIGDDSLGVLNATVEGDPRAVFGGGVMCDFAIGSDEVIALLDEHGASKQRLLHLLAAPSVSDSALLELRRRTKSCRVVTNPALADLGPDSLDHQRRLRYVRGGALEQPNYLFVLDLADPRITMSAGLPVGVTRDVILAWAVGCTSNSNTTTLARDGHLIGNAAGQQDRVTSCELAVRKAIDAGHETVGATAYTDSFFPFVDGPQVLIDAGIRYVFASSGSKRDGEVRELFATAGVTFIQFPDKLGRGFFGH